MVEGRSSQEEDLRRDLMEAVRRSLVVDRSIVVAAAAADGKTRDRMVRLVEVRRPEVPWEHRAVLGLAMMEAVDGRTLCVCA